MRPQLFLGLLHERPFRPFRVHVSDGAWYDVSHPEAAAGGSDAHRDGPDVRLCGTAR